MKEEFPLRNFLYGGIAGSVAKTVVAPMDRVKIHFQVKTPHFSPFLGQLTGVFKAIRAVYKAEGLLGLYRGHSATLARVFPYAAINFMSYEHLKVNFGIGRDNSVSPWKRVLAGSLAGCAAVTATYPFDLLRARIAFITSQEHSAFSRGSYLNAIRQLWQEGLTHSRWGIVGLFQGYVPTMLGIIPYAGTSFFTFDSLKNWYALQNPNDDIPQPVRLVFGMTAGVAAQSVTYPLDIVRRRSQLWRATEHLPPSDSHRPLDTLRLIRQIVRVGGVRDLFVGMSINYFKVAPSMGISFLIFDYLKDNF